MIWNEFSWACFLFHTCYTTDAYSELMTNRRYTELIFNSQFNDEEGGYVAECIVRFLGKYGCHTPNRQDVIDALAEALRNSLEHLAGLAELEIENINFDQNVGGAEQTFTEVVRNLYETFVAVSHIGSTAVGKLLHILRPKLFVMWDRGIREHYEIDGNEEGYCSFLEVMEGLAQEVNEAFQLAHPSSREGPSAYLSQAFEIDHPKPLAKYIDEYNWVRYVRGISGPPPMWFPI